MRRLDFVKPTSTAHRLGILMKKLARIMILMLSSVTESTGIPNRKMGDPPPPHSSSFWRSPVSPLYNLSYAMRCCKRLAGFVLLFCQPTELILFFLFHNFPNFTPPTQEDIKKIKKMHRVGGIFMFLLSLLEPPPPPRICQKQCIK